MVDIFREEDKRSNFFRRNKVFPNQDLSTSFINRISKQKENTYVKSRPVLKKAATTMEDYFTNTTTSMLEVSSELQGGDSPSQISGGNITNFEEAKVKFNSFEILKELGCGSFGRVFLARKINDDQLYAMKVLKKKDLILKKKLRYAITETKILKTCNHPFILQIYFSFQVYFLTSLFNS